MQVPFLFQVYKNSYLKSGLTLSDCCKKEILFSEVRLVWSEVKDSAGYICYWILSVIDWKRRHGMIMRRKIQSKMFIQCKCYTIMLLSQLWQYLRDQCLYLAEKIILSFNYFALTVLLFTGSTLLTDNNEIQAPSCESIYGLWLVAFARVLKVRRPHRLLETSKIKWFWIVYCY